MCGIGGGSDNSADQARAAEAARQKRIDEGTVKINEQFARFDEPFFQGVERAALDFFVPQVQQQFGDTQERLIKNLARQGNLEASTGIRQLGDLDEARNFELFNVADRSRQASARSRADIEQNRSRLLSQLAATADPAAAASAAQASALALTAPPEFSPIGDLFSRFANNAATQIVASREGFKNSFSPLFPARDRSNVVNA